MNNELKRCLDNAYDHIQHEAYNDALSSILEAKELLDPWISIEDRLPEEGQDVDVYCGYRHTDAEFLNRVFNDCVLDFEGDFDHYEPLKGVTHWMPLPLPPK